MEDEDDFVYIGTIVKPIDEDEALPRAGGILTNQKARDKQGRERFHGAFTGGFSAGYYNSVGSKEGWAPKDFASSRSSRADGYKQTPEDFMDSEDLGEFGIAQRQIRASDGFDRTEGTRKRTIEKLSGGLLPSNLLESLVVPRRVPIGEQLLCKMGWKQGQGVGPREKPSEGEGKVYGCSLPPHLTAKISSEFAAGLTFAPDDVDNVTFEPKDNKHGLGYSGLDPSRAGFGHQPNLEEERARPGQPPSWRKKKGISGQAFGVGALNEDDDDVYGQTSISTYDTVLDDGLTDDKFGWTAPKGRKKSSRFQAITDSPLATPIDGFTQSKSVIQPKLVYPAPPLPAGFRAVHTFTTRAPRPGVVPSLLHSVEKGILLGEKIVSVFDLVSKEDKQKIDDVKSAPSLTDQSTSSTGSQSAQSDVTTMTRLSNSDQAPPRSGSDVIEPVTPNRLGQITSGGFDPFAKDPAKAERYNKFRQLQIQGGKEAYVEVSRDASLTDWEREREKDEFTRAAKLYGPLSALMSARFTQSKHADDENDVVMEPVAEDDRCRAARMKMFGKLTREEVTWYPDKILCKRFNVANPYPESTIVGVPQVKRDKFSVWNYLGIPDQNKQNQEPVSQAAEPERPKIAFTVGKSRGKSDPLNETKTIKFSIFADLPDRSSARSGGNTGAVDSSDPCATSGDENSTSRLTNTTSGDTKEIQNKDEPSKALEEVKVDRPPMDLFQAIFGESSDSESENEEIENSAEDFDNKAKEKVEVITEVITEVVQGKDDLTQGKNDEDVTMEKIINLDERKIDVRNTRLELERTEPEHNRSKKSQKFSIFDNPVSTDNDVKVTSPSSHSEISKNLTDDRSRDKSRHNASSFVIGGNASRDRRELSPLTNQYELRGEQHTIVIGQGRDSRDIDNDNTTTSISSTIGQGRSRDNELSLPICESGFSNEARSSLFGPALPPDLVLTPPSVPTPEYSRHPSKHKKHKTKSSKKKKKHKSKDKLHKEKKHKKHKSKKSSSKDKPILVSSSSDWSRDESASDSSNDVTAYNRTIKL